MRRKSRLRRDLRKRWGNLHIGLFLLFMFVFSFLPDSHLMAVTDTSWSVLSKTDPMTDARTLAISSQSLTRRCSMFSPCTPALFIIWDFKTKKPFLKFDMAGHLPIFHGGASLYPTVLIRRDHGAVEKYGLVGEEEVGRIADLAECSHDGTCSMESASIEREIKKILTSKSVVFRVTQKYIDDGAVEENDYTFSIDMRSFKNVAARYPEISQWLRADASGSARS